MTDDLKLPAISVPLRIPVSKKKTFSLNLNVYRNTHQMTLNKAKVAYHDAVAPLLGEIPKLASTKLRFVLYVGSARDADVTNFCCVVDKFFSDILVKLGILPDDNYHYLPEISYAIGGIDRENPRVEVSFIDPILLPSSEENDMKITFHLTYADVLSALHARISELVDLTDEQLEQLDLAPTDDGFVVTLDTDHIGSKASMTPRAVDPKPPVKRTRRTKAEIAAAQSAEAGQDTVPAEDAPDEAPEGPADEGEADIQSDESAEADVGEPFALSQEEGPEEPEGEPEQEPDVADKPAGVNPLFAGAKSSAPPSDEAAAPAATPAKSLFAGLVKPVNN